MSLVHIRKGLEHGREGEVWEVLTLGGEARGRWLNDGEPSNSFGSAAW